MAPAAAAILRLERASDVGEEELVVGSAGVDAQLVGIEEQRRDRAFVELLRLDREEGVLVLAVEDHDGPAARAGDEPLARGVGGEGAPLLGERQPLPGGAAGGVEDQHLGAGERCHGAMPEHGQGRRGGIEPGPVRLDLAGREVGAVHVAVGAGDVDCGVVGRDGDTPAGQRVRIKLALVDVEAVERGGLSLGVDRDERQAVPLGKGGADRAAVGQVLLRAGGFHGSRCAFTRDGRR